MVKTKQIKRKRVKILILFFILNGIVNIAYAQIMQNTEIRNRNFGYINFKKTHITLPDTILKLRLENINIEKTFIQGMFFDKKQKVKVFSDSLRHRKIFFPTEIEWFGKQEVPKSFVNLLCDNGIVNIARDHRTDYWTRIFSNKEDAIIQNFKEWNEFWFLGKISIHPNYDSYLILTEEPDTSDILCVRYLFLMNVKNNIITSLTQVAYKFIFRGEGEFFFTKASSRGKYCYYGISYSECLRINIFGNIKDPKLEKYTYYSFDDSGYVQLHELKGRKKLIIYKVKYKVLNHENIR